MLQHAVHHPVCGLMGLFHKGAGSWSQGYLRSQCDWRISQHLCLGKGALFLLRQVKTRLLCGCPGAWPHTSSSPSFW